MYTTRKQNKMNNSVKNKTTNFEYKFIETMIYRRPATTTLLLLFAAAIALPNPRLSLLLLNLRLPPALFPY